MSLSMESTALNTAMIKNIPTITLKSERKDRSGLTRNDLKANLMLSLI